MAERLAVTDLRGTRFRLFAQPDFASEIVTVSSPAGSVGPGPADSRMYVIDPIGKHIPYGLAEDYFHGIAYLLPPWSGKIFPPAMPDANGHFDYLDPKEPEFEAAHLFGVVRFTLDIWEKYFGYPIDWHFAQDFDRLELVIQRNLLDNAFMGYGFLEVGVQQTYGAHKNSFSLNFDVVAHEVGHCIVYSKLGIPDPSATKPDYYGFHESAADLTALISSMHFSSVLENLLETTRGNLYALNYVNRIAELSDSSQIRIAANNSKLSDFALGWSDEHDLAQPLTGAVFDMLVDIFHEELVEKGLISANSEALSDHLEDDPEYYYVMQPIFDESYGLAPDGFWDALVFARDMIGTMLAETWQNLSPNDLSYDDVGRVLLQVDLVLNGGRYRRVVETNLMRREIGRVRIGPRLTSPSDKSHFNFPRVYTPDRHERCCGDRSMSFREKYYKRRWRAF